MRLQFSLRELLAIIAVVALGCGGLWHPTEYAASFAFTVTLAFLFVAVLGAIARKGSARMFWLGAAVAGWGYLWVAHWTDQEIPVSPNWELQTSGPLLTTKLLRVVLEGLHPPPPPGPGQGFFSVAPKQAGNTSAPAVPVGGRAFVTTMDYERFLSAFMRIGHCLWTLVLAFLGARLTCYLHRTAAPATEKCA